MKIILVIVCFSSTLNYGPFDSEDDAWDFYIEMENPWDFVSFDFVLADTVPMSLVIGV